VYVHGRLINEEIDFHTTKNSTSLSAFGFIFERFLGTGVDWCEGRTLCRGCHNGKTSTSLYKVGNS
jgi:hypothetical protein